MPFCVAALAKARSALTIASSAGEDEPWAPAKLIAQTLATAATMNGFMPVIFPVTYALVNDL
jgi:hypothetical protein